MADIKWKVFEHSMSRSSGDHVIVVGYRSNGRVLGTVLCAMPLYDLRDMNFDGSVSLLERAYTSGLSDPYETFSLMLPAAESDFMIEAGTSVNDYDFVEKAKAAMLHQAYKAAARASVTIAVERFLSPGFEASLAKTALDKMGAKGTAIQFIVQTSAETAVMETICGLSMN